MLTSTTALRPERTACMASCKVSPSLSGLSTLYATALPAAAAMSARRALAATVTQYVSLRFAVPSGCTPRVESFGECQPPLLQMIVRKGVQ